MAKKKAPKKVKKVLDAKKPSWIDKFKKKGK